MKTPATQKPHVSIDDNGMLVTVTVPSGFRPSASMVSEWHDMAGNLGYGIEFVRS